MEEECWEETYAFAVELAMVGQYGCVCELLVYVLMEGMPDYLDA